MQQVTTSTNEKSEGAINPISPRRKRKTVKESFSKVRVEETPSEGGKKRGGREKKGSKGAIFFPPSPR